MNGFMALMLGAVLVAGWSSQAVADHVKDGRQVHRYVYLRP